MGKRRLIFLAMILLFVSDIASATEACSFLLKNDAAPKDGIFCTVRFVATLKAKYTHCEDDKGRIIKRSKELCDARVNHIMALNKLRMKKLTTKLDVVVGELKKRSSFWASREFGLIVGLVVGATIAGVVVWRVRK